MPPPPNVLKVYIPQTNSQMKSPTPSTADETKWTKPPIASPMMPRNLFFLVYVPPKIYNFCKMSLILRSIPIKAVRILLHQGIFQKNIKPYLSHRTLNTKEVNKDGYVMELSLKRCTFLLFIWRSFLESTQVAFISAPSPCKRHVVPKGINLELLFGILPIEL